MVPPPGACAAGVRAAAAAHEGTDWGGDTVLATVSVSCPLTGLCGAPLPSQRGPGACALCAVSYYYYYEKVS